MSFSLTGYIVRDEAFLAHMHLVVFVSINLVISYFTKPSLVLAFIYHVHSLSFSTISILLANKVMLVRKKTLLYHLCWTKTSCKKPFWNGNPLAAFMIQVAKAFLALCPFLWTFFGFSCWCSFFTKDSLKYRTSTSNIVWTLNNIAW